MKFRSFGRAAAWAVWLMAVPALAQTAAPASAAAAARSASSPAKKQLVQKVLQLQQPGIEGFARGVIVEQPVMQMLNSAGPALQAQPADKRQAIANALEADAKKYVEDVYPAVRKRALDLAPQTVGPLLEERFTEAELTTLVAWLESPVSRKFAQMQGDLQRALGERLMADARPTLEPKLKALQQTMAGRLGISVAEPGAPGAPTAPR